MKGIDSSDPLAKAARFGELCVSLGSIAEKIHSEKKDTILPYEVDLVAEAFSELRADFGVPQYSWPDNTGLLVENDYFAMTRLAKQIGVGSVQCDVNGEGRVFGLSLSGGPQTIDEIGLLSELQKLSIKKYGDSDPSHLVNCIKLKSICLKGIDSHMQTLESVLERMPWLKSIEVRGFRAMKLDWARNHRELTSLRVPRLGIEELRPLENCMNLELLDISYNRVHSLEPLKGLPCLRQLDIRGARISDFSTLDSLNSGLSIIISPFMINFQGYSDFKNMILTRGGRVKVADSLSLGF